jgi:hypothetical protein
MRSILKFVRDNSLSLALFGLFVVTFAAAVWSGWLAHNATLAEHHRGGIGLRAYLAGGTFIEGLSVNWQAAILQLGTLIVFSIFLVQRGAPHSRDPDRAAGGRKRRRLTRAHDWLQRNSLSLAFVALFVAAFAVFAVSGAEANNSERALIGAPPMPLGDFLVSSKFWWQTFQTWQAEYLVIALYLVLSIYLRQEGSAESKPKNASDEETGAHNE